jgi:hypothetical protein
MASTISLIRYTHGRVDLPDFFGPFHHWVVPALS